MSSRGSSDAETFELFFRLVGFELEAFQREIVEEVFSPRRETLVLEPRETAGVRFPTSRSPTWIHIRALGYPPRE